MQTRHCPYCGEEIQAEAQKCRYCREWLTAEENTVNASIEDELEEAEGIRLHNSTSVTESKEKLTGLPPIHQAVYEQTRLIPPSMPQDEYRRPLLHELNFGAGKAWSVLLLALPLVSFVVAVYLAIADERNYFSAVLLASGVAYSVAFSILLNFVLEYMQNFGVSGNLRSNIRMAQASMIGLALFVFMVWVIYPRSNNGLFFLFLLLLLVVCTVALFLTGLSIYKARERDFIGGCDTLGVFIMVGLFVSPMWYFIPIFTFRMFSKAEKYSGQYGVAGE